MVKRVVKMDFREDGIEDFLAIFAESSPQIRRFPGCRRLELWRCRQPHNIFFTYSWWDSEEALDEYRRSELFRATWALTKALFARPAEAWSVDTAELLS
jgi:heme-degrading monooxygenase HmoA